MSDAEKINEKLDEVKEAIENINVPNNSDLGLIINESLINNCLLLEKQLKEINNNLRNIDTSLRNLQSRMR
ncbi:MAG: hypothetical protein ABH864_06735 [archaeon]